MVLASPKFRKPATLLVAALTLVLPACESGGHFTVLGYTTRPNYDTTIHTVYVPIFKNHTFYKGLEFDLTRAVVREIEAKTPYKVVSNEECADTVLTGTIISYNQNVLNRNQLNEIREMETTMGAEVIWRDRRTGEVLSRPRDPNAPQLGTFSMPVANGRPEGPLPPLPEAKPTLVQSLAGYIPEIGQSITTAEKDNVDRLAIQIVSQMEKPW
jgi:hypothetical protein